MFYLFINYNTITNYIRAEKLRSCARWSVTDQSLWWELNPYNPHANSLAHYPLDYSFSLLLFTDLNRMSTVTFVSDRYTFCWCLKSTIRKNNVTCFYTAVYTRVSASLMRHFLQNESSISFGNGALFIIVCCCKLY